MSQENNGMPQSPSARPRWFGQKIIKTNFQLKFSFIILAFLTFATLIIYLEGRWIVNKMIETGIVQQGEATTQLQLLNGIIFKTSVILLAITFALTLFFSHFIAGPIYRFEKTLEAMRSGDFTVQVRLRKHDELKEVGDLFNQTLASLRVKLKKERDLVSTEVEKLVIIVDKLKQTGKLQEALEVEQILTNLKNNPPQIRI
ncbi:MAG: HAMP domain-containing protein [Elusimicrobiota bacterium]